MKRVMLQYSRSLVKLNSAKGAHCAEQWTTRDKRPHALENACLAATPIDGQIGTSTRRALPGPDRGQHSSKC